MVFTLGAQSTETTDEGFLFLDLPHLSTGFRVTVDVRELLPSFPHVAYTVD